MSKEKKKRYLCDLPWSHLSIHPHGNASICCVADHSNIESQAIDFDGDSFKVMTVKSGIEKIINSDSYKKIRREMLAGKRPAACNTCWKVEDVGGKSKRLRDSQFRLDFDGLTKLDGSIDVDLTNIELRLGNYCNLKCRSCNAESSTSWISDYYQLKDVVPLPSNFDSLKKYDWVTYDWVEDESFYNQLIKNSPNINMLHISGGEPFLVPKHFYLLDKLVSDGLSKNIKIFYITNGNYDFEKIAPALDKLQNFFQVYISFSLDDVMDRNTYIRSLSDWDLTIKNIKLFIKNYDFNYTITQTFNAYNFLYAEELSQFLLKSGLYNLDGSGPICRIIPNHVHSPEYQNATVLPKKIRQDKLNSINGLISEELYNDLYGRYYHADDNNQMDLFLKVTDAVDRIRKEQLFEVFPKLYNIIK